MSQMQIFVLSTDPRTKSELSEFMQSLDGPTPIVQFASEARQAIQSIRNLQPGLILLELNRDLMQLQLLMEEIQLAAPEAIVAGMFRPELFAADISESAYLIEAIRLGVKDFLRRPMSTTDFSRLWKRLTEQKRPNNQPLARVISFISNKGGVGKSTISTNVAFELGRRYPDRVLLIDASLQMGVCSSLLNLQPETTLGNCIREANRLDETLIRRFAALHPSGLHLLACPPTPEEAAQINEEVMSRIISLARRTYDYVIIDTFPLLDRVILSILDLSDRVFVVLDNVVPTVIGATRLIDLLDRLGFPQNRQRIVLNRSNCYSSLAVTDVANRLNREIDFPIPEEKQILKAANLGQPYVGKAGRFNRFRKGIWAIIRDLEQLQANATLAREKE